MNRENIKKLRQLNVATHRDLGYFFTVLIIIYCVSGLALNHVDDWNPDFIIHRDTIKINSTQQATQLNDSIVSSYGKLVGETKYKVYDSPTPDQVKIYYNNASLHLNFSSLTGIYEKVERRPVFYRSNILHRNSVKGWKWVSDIFAVLLIVISCTGLFVLKGKYGITGRGKWLITAGAMVPLVAFIIHELS